MIQGERATLYQPKIVNGSKISCGKRNSFCIITDKHFNRFQKIMIKWCFGFEVEDYSEV